MIRRYLPQSTEELIRWYERYVSPLSLLIGFTIDAIAVEALDIYLYSFVLLFHLSLAATGIITLHLIERGVLRWALLLRVAPFIPVAVQYAFGGLFSGFILLYSQSAGFATSWIFVVLLAALLLGNERFRRVYATFPVQIGILYFALFSFLIFFIPIVVQDVGPWVFVVSGVLSLACISGLLYTVALLAKSFDTAHRRAVVRVVVGVFVCINVLYFWGAIPPLPLALRDAGVLHSIVRSNGHYDVSYEPKQWYEFYRRYNPVFHRTSGETVYVYTAIFAPDGISTTILHNWQRFDEENEEWVTEASFDFPIRGGRDGGYRGYTLKDDVESGKWRVNVVTDYGQLIGRVSFEVTAVTTPVALEEGKR